MRTNDRLQTIAKAYDATVDEYDQGIDDEDKLPEDFKKSAEYLELQQLGASSGMSEIKEFLQPREGMKFLDVGSCANLFTYRLDQWGSLYYGVDISPKLVERMKGFAKRNKLHIGGMFVADMAKLPFEDDFFDIAAVIGVLEYYDLPYMENAFAELSRVLKRNSKVVLDVLNTRHKLTDTMMKTETYKGRSYPKKVPSNEEVESALDENFTVEKADVSGPMATYYLTVKK